MSIAALCEVSRVARTHVIMLCPPALKDRQGVKTILSLYRSEDAVSSRSNLVPEEEDTSRSFVLRLLDFLIFFPSPCRALIRVCESGRETSRENEHR